MLPTLMVTILSPSRPLFPMVATLSARMRVVSDFTMLHRDAEAIVRCVLSVSDLGNLSDVHAAHPHGRARA